MPRGDEADSVPPPIPEFHMRGPIPAAFAYFGCVFAAGFVLGVVRTLYVVPRLGETFAVAMELPIILAIAWIACRRLTNRLEVPSRLLPRATMGAVAFALLMAAELAISLLLDDRGPTEHLRLYREAPHVLGLAGQIVFALFPILRIWAESPPSARRKQWQ